MPGWTVDLVVGTIAAVIGGLLLLGLAGAVSTGARWALTGLLSRILGIDIEIVFSNPRQAVADVQKELAVSSTVLLMTGRGSELQRETFEPLLSALQSSPGRHFRILLPQPNIAAAQVDWIQRREDEVKTFDKAYGSGLLRQQIVSTLKFLESYASSGSVEYRCYSLPLLGRILITDGCAYLTPYSRHAHSRSSKVIKYRCGGMMYGFLKGIFDEAWETSGAPILLANRDIS